MNESMINALLLQVPAGPGSLAASGCAALAVGWLSWEVALIMTSSRPDHLVDPFEVERRKILREQARFYRWFEPIVDQLAAWNLRWFPRQLDQVQRDLELLEPQLPWRAAEFLAVKELESLQTVCVGWLPGYIMFGPVGALFFAALVLFITPLLAIQGLAKKSTRYRAKLRLRLPFVVDLLALMLESGSIIRECLEKAAAENEGSPLGIELRRVFTQMERGIALADALTAMADRLCDEPDVCELVLLINTAEERGTSLRHLLTDLSERMRNRRIQLLEQAAEEAKVHITWPALLIMVACLLIMAAPLVLQALAGQ
jgi:Flp pilus assembly protein TadB